MAAITAQMVKELRGATGAGMLDCKNALSETDGDFDRAVEYLREKGLAAAAKKADRVAHEGIIGTYVHHGSKLAAMVELNCETDFVARTEQFQGLAHDLAMHIVAADPEYVAREEVPADVLDREMSIYKAQAQASGKPERILDRIAQGKLEKWYSDVCLMEQEYFKDSDRNVKDVLVENISGLGENIQVRRFSRMQVG